MLCKLAFSIGLLILAKYPGPPMRTLCAGGEKRALYPAFTHVLNFTFFRYETSYSRVEQHLSIFIPVDGVKIYPSWNGNRIAPMFLNLAVELFK